MYHHTVSGLANTISIQQYDYDSHIEAWLLSRIKVVGPFRACNDYLYSAKLDNDVAYGSSPSEAKAELMANLGY